MTQDKHIAVLANPLAGDGRALEYLGSLERYLRMSSIPHQTYTLHWPDDLTGFTDIWLIGGDGTLNFFVNRYTELSLPITFFDGGTGNDFHAALYGKRSLAARTPVDNVIALVNQTLFIQAHEGLAHGARKAGIERKAFAGPVTTDARALHLLDDAPAVFLLPLPDAG